MKHVRDRATVGGRSPGKTDIIWQFLFEAVLISISGGLIGIVLGIAIAMGISQVADIPTGYYPVFHYFVVWCSRYRWFDFRYRPGPPSS